MTAPRPNGIGEGRGEIQKPETHPTTVGAEIKAEYFRLVSGTLSSAKRLGELLRPIRASLKHGEWLPWVKANCPFDDRRAREFIQIAENWTRIEAELKAKSAVFADFPISDALKLLAKPKPAETVELDLVPDLEAVLIGNPGVWVCPHEDGVRFLTPSVEHPGHAFVDNINTTEGYADIAQRPMKFAGLHLFYPGSIWLKSSSLDWSHGGTESVGDFFRLCLPERVNDCAALGIIEEVLAETA